jgi:hypothetical protein
MITRKEIIPDLTSSVIRNRGVGRINKRGDFLKKLKKLVAPAGKSFVPKPRSNATLFTSREISKDKLANHEVTCDSNSVSMIFDPMGKLEMESQFQPSTTKKSRLGSNICWWDPPEENLTLDFCRDTVGVDYC